METFIRRFDELTLEQLYKILQLRNKVFIVEQDCPYLDIDSKDQDCLHVFYMENSNIIAYTRIVPGNIPAIGRVVVAESYRKNGLAKKIMADSINLIEKEFGKTKIKLQAQTYLQNFYEGFGFSAVSEEYLEDNIPHRDMIRIPAQRKK